MIFVGKPGTGKTHLAVGIALEVMDRGYSALYSSVLRALRSVKDGFSTTGESETAVVKRLAVPDLLILDEAGISYETDTEAMILYEIVNQRYEEKKPTLFTSNYTLAELQKVMGDRVIDRLRESGGEVVYFEWKSWRAKGGLS
jgi:DNA replication protein DnaC